MEKKPKTIAAIEARWGVGTPEERWAEKVTTVVSFIARLGWATVELVNFYLEQSKRDWPTKMVDQGWLISKKAIINDKPATILVLTYKAHQLAKNQHPFIGRRIEKEVSRQSGHDFIATWVTLKALKARYGLTKVKERYTIWADRVMRGFLDNEFARPDISIYEQDMPKINIEVERTRKRTDFEKYQFLKKLKNYSEKGIKTIVVFESREKAVRFAREVQDAAMGVTPWIYSNAWNKWILSKDDVEIFNVRVLILIWDYDQKSITEAFMSEDKGRPIDVNTLTPYRS
jgi:hypothetical protein